MRFLNSNRAAIGSLVVLWLAVRIYAMLAAEPHMSLEVQQARKLLEYGISTTHGAPLWSPSGRLPNPEAFVYTHHPYPIFWVIAAIYAVAGPAMPLILMAALKLVACILFFKVLAVHFSRPAAWIAAAIYATAPAGLLEDISASGVAFSAVFFPIGAWLLVGRGNAKSPISAWWFGIFALVAAQVDWLAITAIPALIALTILGDGPWRGKILELSRNRAAWALAIGATLGAILFFVQVAIYMPHLSDLGKWMTVKAGANAGGPSKVQLLGVVLIRTTAFVGIPLMLGAVIGMFRVTRSRNPLAIAAVVHLVCCALLVLIIPNYFYMERTVYPTLLAATAILTALAIDQFKRFGWIAAGLCIPGLLYAHLLLSVPEYSPTSKQLAVFFAKNSKNTDVVLTNLKLGAPPYAQSDITGGKATAQLSDRRIYFNVERPYQVAGLTNALKCETSPLLFAMAKSIPISEELATILREHATHKTTVEVAVPPITESLAGKVRAFVWYKLMRKAAAPTQVAPAATFTFDIYEMTLEDPVWKSERRNEAP